MGAGYPSSRTSALRSHAGIRAYSAMNPIAPPSNVESQLQASQGNALA
jgi:hypothetical protein